MARRRRKSAPRYSAAQKIEQVLAGGELSAADLARKLRLTPGKLRGRRSGRGELTEAQARKLTALATKSRAQARQAARRQAIVPPKGATILPPPKRLTKRYEHGKPLPEPKPGKIIELNTEGLSPGAIFDVLWPYREQALARGRRRKREPGSFRFVVRERRRKPTRPEEGRAVGPRHSAYVRRLIEEKRRVQHRKPREERGAVEPIYMTRPISWTAVLEDHELVTLIADILGGRLERATAGYRVEIIGVRIYP